MLKDMPYAERMKMKTKQSTPYLHELQDRVHRILDGKEEGDAKELAGDCKRLLIALDMVHDVAETLTGMSKSFTYITKIKEREMTGDPNAN